MSLLRLIVPYLFWSDLMIEGSMSIRMFHECTMHGCLTWAPTFASSLSWSVLLDYFSLHSFSMQFPVVEHEITP